MAVGLGGEAGGFSLTVSLPAMRWSRKNVLSGYPWNPGEDATWMGSHFHDWIDYIGVTFSTELLELGRTFSYLLGYGHFFILTVKKGKVF